MLILKFDSIWNIITTLYISIKLITFHAILKRQHLLPINLHLDQLTQFQKERIAWKRDFQGIFEPYQKGSLYVELRLLQGLSLRDEARIEI